MAQKGMERCLLRVPSSRSGNWPQHPPGQERDSVKGRLDMLYGRGRSGIWCDTRLGLDVLQTRRTLQQTAWIDHAVGGFESCSSAGSSMWLSAVAIPRPAQPRSAVDLLNDAGWSTYCDRLCHGLSSWWSLERGALELAIRDEGVASRRFT
jgi:hypothetical protein